MSTTTTGLPTSCPSWCDNTHEQAIDEGCKVKEARVHGGPDVGGVTEVHGERFAWELQLHADPGPEVHFYGMPVLDLESRRVPAETDSDRFRWRMDSGAARVLARQLLHFADLADLDT